MKPNKHHGKKARAYHKRWCQRGEQYGGFVIWRFALASKFSRFTEMRERKYE